MKYFITTIIAIISIISCNLDPTLASQKEIDIKNLKVANLFNLLKGSHTILTTTDLYGRDLIIVNELRSDNCFSNGNSGRLLKEPLLNYNPLDGFIWRQAYRTIANVNIIIGADLALIEGDKEKIRHIQGQARGVRALAYFDLLRVYGQQHTPSGNLGVPIIKKFLEKGKLFPPRNTIDQVKEFIYQDLKDAYGMMNSKFDSKIYISKDAVKALESRVAIYFGDWTVARDAALAVINTGNYSIAPASEFVSNWTKDTPNNSIFELEFNKNDNRGINGLAFMYRFESDKPSGYGDVEVRSNVIDLFEANDVRKNILGYQDKGNRLRNMGKYPNMITRADNVPLIRIEEVVLNYAEALFELKNNIEALNQLNSIPTNRNATPYSQVTKENIILERRKELMFEGFRFDDLMRTKSNIQTFDSQQKQGKTFNYPNNKFAYPIPKKEMGANSNMVQNAGYFNN